MKRLNFTSSIMEFPKEMYTADSLKGTTSLNIIATVLINSLQYY